MLRRPFDYDRLTALFKERGHTGRMPKKDALVDGLIEVGNLVDLVVALTHVETKSPLNPDAGLAANGIVVQCGKDVFGPLGLLRSLAARKEAYQLVTLLQEGAKTGLLEELARRCSRGHPHQAACQRYAKQLPPAIRRLAQLQLVLVATNDEIAAATNQTLRDLGMRFSIPNSFFLDQWTDDWADERCPAPPCAWGFPRYGEDGEPGVSLLDACLEQQPTRALGIILHRFGGAALKRETESMRARDPVAAAMELVLSQGPGRILETFLSSKDLWELLNEWDLAIPPLMKVTREELLDVLFVQVGLQYVAPPRGLHRLRRDLVQRDASVESEPLMLLLEFEQAYQELLCAFVAYGAGGFDELDQAGQIAQLLVGIPDDLDEQWSALLPEKGVASLSFGGKVDLMKKAVAKLAEGPEDRGWMGRPSPDLAGPAVQAVVATRNALVHGRQAPTLEQVRAAILDALDSMIGPDTATGTCPVPYRVRVLEETTDVYGWCRMTLETELGEKVSAENTLWDRPRKAAFLFGSSNPAVVEPVLIW